MPLTLESTLPFPLEWLPQPAYLVGGAVRDWLIQKHLSPHEGSSKIDLDLVLQDAPIAWASQVARRLGGGFVVLDAEREIARIVLKTATLDIAKQIGTSVESDLKARDFTCNAIAWELHSHQWVDPLKGTEAIRQKQIRMIHPHNLTADPLRLLRAYRQAAQLGFELDPLTQEAIRQRSHLLSEVAGERVRAEISYLLAAGAKGLIWLQQAWCDQLLQDWLPLLTPTGFEVASHLDPILTHFKQHYLRSYQAIDDPIADQRSMRMIIQLAALVCYPTPDLEQLVATMDALKFSRAERQIIHKVCQLLPPFLELLTPTPSPQEMYQFFLMAEQRFPALALLAIAMGVDQALVNPWLQHYEDPQDPLAHPVALIDGKQLMHALKLKPGPLIGKLLSEIGLAQALGQIQTFEEAMSFARNYLDCHHL